MVRTFKSYSLGKFQLCNTILSTIITLDIRSSDFVLSLKVCTLLPTLPISLTPPFYSVSMSSTFLSFILCHSSNMQLFVILKHYFISCLCVSAHVAPCASNTFCLLVSLTSSLPLSSLCRILPGSLRPLTTPTAGPDRFLVPGQLPPASGPHLTHSWHMPSTQ